MTEPDAEQVRINQEYIEFMRLARLLKDNQQLKVVVRSAEPFMRRPIYDALKPHLFFKAKPYLLLK